MKKLLTRFLIFVIILAYISYLVDGIIAIRYYVFECEDLYSVINYGIKYKRTQYLLKETISAILDLIFKTVVAFLIIRYLNRNNERPCYISARIELAKEKIKAKKKELAEKRKIKLKEKLEKLNSEENE